MSDELRKYIKKNKRYKKMVLFTQIFILFLFIYLWQLFADGNIINSFITSSPKNIVNTLINVYKNNNLLFHIWITIKETMISFIITSVLSIIFAVLLYNFKFLSKVLEPYLVVLNSLPKVALGPIIIIWAGANTNSIIVISVLISIIVSIQSIYNGFENTDKLKIKLLDTFNASKLDKLLYVVLPSNKNVIMNTLKINISMCLIGLLPPVGEKNIFSKYCNKC